MFSYNRHVRIDTDDLVYVFVDGEITNREIWMEFVGVYMIAIDKTMYENQFDRYEPIEYAMKTKIDGIGYIRAFWYFG